MPCRSQNLILLLLANATADKPAPAVHAASPLLRLELVFTLVALQATPFSMLSLLETK